MIHDMTAERSAAIKSFLAIHRDDCLSPLTVGEARVLLQRVEELESKANNRVENACHGHLLEDSI